MRKSIGQWKTERQAPNSRNPVSKTQECLISVELAYTMLQVVEQSELPTENDRLFRCPGCRRPVRPQKTDRTIYFEHIEQNPNCSAQHMRIA
jgi:hypothetical protein